MHRGRNPFQRKNDQLKVTNPVIYKSEIMKGKKEIMKEKQKIKGKPIALCFTHTQRPNVKFLGMR